MTKRATGTTGTSLPDVGRAASLPDAEPDVGRAASLPDVVISGIEPLVDGGRFSAKAIVGDPLEVSADVFTHGHDLVRAKLRLLHVASGSTRTLEMIPLGNDRFQALFVPELAGYHELTILGETDELATWCERARARSNGGAFDPDDPEKGAAMVGEARSLLLEAAEGQDGADATEAVGPSELDDLTRLATELLAARDATGLESALCLLEGLWPLLARRPFAALGASVTISVLAQRERAAFSSWYECFPRSSSTHPGRHGTLLDLARRLDYVAELGFDVLYLPPIHPIGHTARKGRDNTTPAGPDDVGSPWAIGSEAGGHEAIAPELGNLEDFSALVAAATDRGIEVALDLAFQCSPDHPWVREHPQWFAHRADGSIACAENPPKRYEDVYPLDFATSDRLALFEALLGIVSLWRERGVRIFRVDNPHTKPFAFWEWLIGRTRREDPEVIFLAEAFTRPKVMHQLAKLGFDQSYTYFAWRDTKHELCEYFLELAHGPGRSYFRPNVWPNTPDILAKSLQRGGRAAFIARLVLAAGLSASYGIYGPVFELLVDEPVRPGSEEYLSSEKYEVRFFDLGGRASIAPVVSRLNAARRAHRALQRDGSLAFHHVDNDQILCWSKHDPPTDDIVVGVVNLDVDWPQSGIVELDAGLLGIGEDDSYVVTDLLDGESYTWHGKSNFVLLDPGQRPAHLFVIDRPDCRNTEGRAAPG